ncbi:hypothetical protein [Paracoccus hibiscisoli]|uniref:Uncharacterized protein n=1 Tax=Paracoccus hibiscisoli TaxID=2023261 RepID=A0A4U0QVT3_9RHOB|nr:hypothetical protein [Paracoccus hibiscisoli]TJZ86146.1 hypothetical protein FA740_04465 [Paracoccus hibiscisoli]
MTIYDGKMGAGRLQQERDRLAAILARATPAEGCGPAIPVAPARGPSKAVTPNVVMPDPKTNSGYKVEATGWRGFRAAKAIDVFDVLEQREIARATKAKRPPALPFTRAQVDIARRYRDLVEHHAAGGMKCASLETRGGGGGTGGEFIDAYISVGREIRTLQDRIGTGAAMVVRRVRPSARGVVTASIIRDRDLVDAVCLEGKSFVQVLESHGWSDTGRNTSLVQDALGKCLDRMNSARGKR